jgi:hypothetical protein
MWGYHFEKGSDQVNYFEHSDNVIWSGENRIDKRLSWNANLDAWTNIVR